MDDELLIISPHDLDRCCPAQCIQPFLERSHARFTCIIRDDLIQHILTDLQILASDPDGPHCLGQQVLFGDLKLLERCISLEGNDLHPVKKRRRYGVQRVRRADEEHAGKVIRYIHIVIRKCIVLLRIEHFQKGTRRIAVVGGGELVDLVEYHDRVRNTALRDPIHDPAGHSPDIGPSVSPDIRLIPHTAEAHPDILSIQRLRDSLTDACLAGPGRSDEQEDRSGLHAFQIHDRDLLQDPLFDLVKAVVRLIQNLFSFIKIDRFCLLLLPGKPGDKIKVIVEDSRLHTVRSLLLQPVQDLVRLLPSGLVHARLLDPDLEFADLGHFLRMHLVEFFLQILDLPADRGFPVDLLILFLLGTLCLIVDLVGLKILIDHALKKVKPFSGAVQRKYRVLLLRRIHHPGGHGCGDLADGCPLREKCRHHSLPVRHLHREGVDRGLHFFQAERLLLPVDRIRILPLRYIEIDRVIPVDRHLVDIHPVRGAHNEISALVDFRDHARDADRVKAVFPEFLAEKVLLRQDEHRLLPLVRNPSGHLRIMLAHDHNIAERYNNSVINRNYCHVVLLFCQHSHSSSANALVKNLTPPGAIRSMCKMSRHKAWNARLFRFLTSRRRMLE